MKLIESHKSIYFFIRTHSSQLLALSLIFIFPLCIFVLLARGISQKETFAFDHKILLFMQANSNSFLNEVMIFFSKIGSLFCIVPIGILILIAFIIRKYWLHASFLLLSVTGAVLLNLTAKSTFARTRPDLWPSIAPETTFSFPSGHAMQSMAIAGSLIALFWSTKYRWPVMIIGSTYIVMVGTSRVYLGVHYPSDILAGWAASIVLIFALRIGLYSKKSR